MQELDLRGNAISEVPAAIGNLTALTRCGLLRLMLSLLSRRGAGCLA